MKTNLNTPKVFFHKNCNDGMGAAVALYNKMPESTTYIPLQYGEPIDVVEGDDFIVFIDYTPKADEIEEVLSKMNPEGRLVIMDHHKTAISNIEEYLDRRKGMDVDKRFMFLIYQPNCGALLGYHILKPSDLTLGKAIVETEELFTNLNVSTMMDSYTIIGNMIHKFYTLLDVRDRWVTTDHILKQSADDLSAFLFNLKWTSRPVSENVKMLNDMTTKDFDDMLMFGSILNKAKMNQAESLVEKSLKLDVNDKNDKLVKLALVFTDSVVSDAGSIWSNMNTDDGSLFVGIMVMPDQGLVVLSTRSNKLASAKVFCEAHGGGGHDQAAGCKPEGMFNMSPEDMIELIKKTISENEIVV